MRITSLLSLFAVPAAMAMAIATGGCVEAVIDTDCVDTLDRTFELSTPAEPALQFKIDSCRVDVEACPALCQVTMERNNLHNAPTRCKVSFGDSAVDVKVWYEVYIGGSNCPSEPIPDIEQPPTFIRDTAGDLPASLEPPPRERSPLAL